MPRAVFETRFFIYFFSSSDPELHKLLLDLMRKYDKKLVSAITFFEICKLSLEREGRGTAETRISRIRREFNLIPVDDAIAVLGAQLKHAANIQRGQDIPMADSLIAATSLTLNATCLSDDPHFKAINEIKTNWIC